MEWTRQNTVLAVVVFVLSLLFVLTAFCLARVVKQKNWLLAEMRDIANTVGLIDLLQPAELGDRARGRGASPTAASVSIYTFTPPETLGVPPPAPRAPHAPNAQAPPKPLTNAVQTPQTTLAQTVPANR